MAARKRAVAGVRIIGWICGDSSFGRRHAKRVLEPHLDKDGQPQRRPEQLIGSSACDRAADRRTDGEVVERAARLRQDLRGRDRRADRRSVRPETTCALNCASVGRVMSTRRLYVAAGGLLPAPGVVSRCQTANGSAGLPPLVLPLKPSRENISKSTMLVADPRLPAPEIRDVVEFRWTGTRGWRLPSAARSRRDCE